MVDVFGYDFVKKSFYDSWEIDRLFLWTKEQWFELEKVIKQLFNMDINKIHGEVKKLYSEILTSDLEGNKFIIKKELPPKKPKPITCLDDWNYKLSVIGLVYDGNTKYLYDFVENTKLIEVDYEVIVVDNRDDKTEPLKYNSDKVKVVSTEKNLGIVDGRRFGFEHSTGDYIWFVDIDDKILNVYKRNYSDNDIIHFEELSKQEGFASPSTSYNIDVKSTFYSTLTSRSSLWLCWIKRDILEKAYKKIPHFFGIYLEDTLVKFMCFVESECVYYTGIPAIYYHTRNIDSVTEKSITDKKDLDRLFIGKDTVDKIFEDNGIYMKEFYRHDILFYAERMYNMSPDLISYYVDKLFEVYGDDAMNDFFDNYKQFKCMWLENS